MTLQPLLCQSIETVLRHAGKDLFQTSPAPACRADHSRVKQSEIDNPVVTLVFRSVNALVAVRQVGPLPCRADHPRVKQSEIDNPFVTLVSRRGYPQRLSGPSSFFVALRG